MAGLRQHSAVAAGTTQLVRNVILAHLPPMRTKIPPREDVPQRKRTEKAEPGPVATLAQLRASTCWVWLICDGCGRQRPAALAPFLIRWAGDASSDLIRRSARCSTCRKVGARTMHPSYMDAVTGWAPYPAGEPTASEVFDRLRTECARRDLLSACDGR